MRNPMFNENHIFQDEQYYPSTAQLRQLFNSSNDIICSVKLDRTLVHMNKAIHSVLGYQPGELMGQDFLDFVFADDKAITVEVFDSIIRGEEKINFVNRVYKSDSSLVSLSWSCRWDARERIMICVAREINDRNKEKGAASSEAQILFQKQQMNDILERITDGFFALDKDWCFVYANSQVEKILDIRREDYLTLNFWECFPSLAKTVYYEQFHKAMRTGKSVHFEGYFQAFEKWFVLNAHPSESGLSVFFRDITAQKRAEEELRRSNERFQLAAKAGAIYDWDLVTNKLQWGDGLFDLLGYDPEEMQIEQWEELLYPADKEWTSKSLSNCLQDKTALFWEAEYRIKKKDNTYCFVFERGYIVRNEKGDAIRMVGKLEDITVIKMVEAERHQYSDKLKEQNEMMVEVLEQLSDGFITIDRDGKVLYWNAAEERISGVPREAVLGKIIWEVVPALKETEFYALFHKFKNNPDPIHRRFYSTFSKKWVEVHAFATRKSISLFLRDITEQKEIEDQLENLSLIAKETENGVAITAPDRKTIWINAAYTRMTGYTPEEMIGRTPASVLEGPDTDPETVRYIMEEYKKERPFHVEILNYKKSGEPFWSELHIQPVFNADGSVKHYFSIRKDITERKKLEQELEEQRKKTTAAVIVAQEKERSIVSQELHDNVNQVLTTVKLYNEMCRDGIGDPQDILNKSIKLLQESITEIRSLSKRLSAPSLGNIKLRDSVKELVDAVNETGKLSICLDTCGIDDLEVDKDLHLAVYRIIQEHLTNILKHAAANEVHIRMDFQDLNLTLNVIDDGNGFDIKRKSYGIGITNMVSRAESVKGSLTIKSAPGQGCEMNARFPLEL